MLLVNISKGRDRIILTLDRRRIADIEIANSSRVNKINLSFKAIPGLKIERVHK